MELTSAIVNMQQARVMGQIQLRVARKVMDAQQLQGAAMVKLIEAAGNSQASAGDALVAAATGLGATLDTYG